MAGTWDFVIDQGATFDRTLTWYSDETRTTTLNLTGYSAAMQIRKFSDSSTTVVSLTSGAGITLGGVAGTIRVLISAATTTALVPGSYVHDLELVSGDGVVTRLLAGKVTVKAEVTR